VLAAARPYEEFGRVFGKPDGTKWQAGDRLVQRELAGTLRQIAEQGADAFYTGPIGEQLVAEMTAGGGMITRADLAAYRANVRQPIHGTFRGYNIYAPPPPSSGGVALIEMLNILEQFPLRAQGRWSAATTHQMVEAMRRAYVDRARFLGDPAFTDVPVAKLTSKPYAQELAAGISADRATPSQALAPEIPLADEPASTTHFSVIDREGNAVANTYTLQDSYGSYVVVRGAGFLLNNEITDFNLQPGRTSRAGQIGTDANLVAAGKRMLSSQTPTIVCRDGHVVLVTGTPGGRTIINTVLQVVLNVIEFDMAAAEAVAAPRLHHQWLPDQVRYEPGKLTPDTLKQLEAMGHRLVRIERQGDAHSIWVDPASGQYHGVADGRISGRAVGY
jgi:gamma-glutamyltranspeptidase/glutathione hydrolase